MGKQYKVTVDLPADINATQRIRAGIVVSREHGYVGELTEEQLKAIQADSYLTVTEAKSSGSSEEDKAKADAEKKAKADADKAAKEQKKAAEKAAKDAKTTKAKAEKEAKAKTGKAKGGENTEPATSPASTKSDEEKK